MNRSKQTLKKRDERHIKKLTIFVKMFNIRYSGVDISEQLNIIKADQDVKSKVVN